MTEPFDVPEDPWPDEDPFALTVEPVDSVAVSLPDPPQDVLWAEQVVLGSVLLTNGAGLSDLDLRLDDFYRPTHGALWVLFQEMVAEGLPVEPVSVLARIRENAGKDPLSPGRTVDALYLHSLLAACQSPMSAPHYARILREAADLRAIRTAGMRMVQAGSAEDGEIAKANARETLDRLDARDTGSATVVVGDALIDVVAAIEKGATPGLTTPWADLDRLIGGLRPGALYVVGGRPGTAKSLVALLMAWHVAVKHGPVLFHSLEMPTDELVRRVLSAESGVAFTSIVRSDLGDLEWKRLENHYSKIAAAPLHIDDRGTLRLDEVAASARRLARTGLKLLVVDYLQLITPRDSRVTRQEQVAEFSRTLKLLAKDLGIPVVALSQLNRAPEGRASRRPTLSDLRESGAIEQDADVVMLLYRDEDNAPNVLEVGVAKNRQGETAAVQLVWQASHMQLRSQAWSA